MPECWQHFQEYANESGSLLFIWNDKPKKEKGACSVHEVVADTVCETAWNRQHFLDFHIPKRGVNIIFFYDRRNTIINTAACDGSK